MPGGPKAVNDGSATSNSANLMTAAGWPPLRFHPTNFLGSERRRNMA
jgi:hypothetical protein